MKPLPHPNSAHSRSAVTAIAVLALVPAACGGGGGGGGGGGNNLPPNHAPVIQVPAGLAGQAPRYSLALPTGDTRTLQFLATDADGDALQWQLAIVPQAGLAMGLVYQTPVNGTAFELRIDPVLATTAGTLQLLVQDPRGGAAAIDLAVARTGAPTLTGVSPDSAFTGQPQDVTLTGTAFLLGGAVSTGASFGGLPATNVVVSSDSELHCRTPLGLLPPGPTLVGVGHAFGSALLPANAFTMCRFPPQFTATDQRLDTVSAQDLRLCADAGLAHAAWIDAGQVRYRRSTDGGQTWEPSQPLSVTATTSSAQLFAAGGGVTAVWLADGNSVWARHSLDGGQTWQTAQRLDVETVPETVSSRPRLCGDGSRRYVAWLEGDPLQLQAHVTVAASADSGATWSQARRIGTSTANQGACEIAGVGARAVVTFEDDRLGPTVRGVYAARTADGGASWSDDHRLSRTDVASAGPRIAASDFGVHVVWQRSNALFYNGSQDGGATWRLVEDQVRGTDAGALTEPAICCEHNRVYVFYVAAGTDVWLTRSTDPGVFTTNVRLSTAAAPAAEPVAATQGQYVFASWRRGDVGSGAARVVHAESTDVGASFTVPSGLGDGTQAQEQPVLAHLGARILLAWLDHRTGGSAAFVNASAP